jgi:hypothetical protein
MANYESKNFLRTRRQLQANLIANIPSLILSGPGIGKSTLADDMGPWLTEYLLSTKVLKKGQDVPVLTVLGSTLDPTDVGGFPVVGKDGAFDRIPMRAIREAAQRPCILFLDELTTVAKAVESTLLMLILARQAGDVQLHPETRIICAANPPEQAPGGGELSSPLMGRVQVWNLAPTIAPVGNTDGEVFNWFVDVLGSEDGTVADLAREFGAVLVRKPDLVQLDPPDAAINEAAQYGAPRNWERGLRALGSLIDHVDGADREDHFTALAAAVGPHQAQAFLAIRDLRDKVPSAEELSKNPGDALVPENRDEQIGVLGVLAEVLKSNSYACWIYAARLHDEIGVAAAQLLMRSPQRGPKKQEKDGLKARNRLMGLIGRMIR